MKILRILLLAVVVLILNQYVKAQDWILQNPFSVLGTVRDIQMNADGRGVAVGDNSILLFTENGGEIWQVAEDPVSLNVFLLCNGESIHLILEIYIIEETTGCIEIFPGIARISGFKYALLKVGNK